jgi:hypothetical protein
MSQLNKPLEFHEILEGESVHLGLLEKRDVPADPEQALRQLQERILDADEKSAALCFSGGGIRSATFNLGVLQGLARLGLLQKFYYLSTVSGGGYIGGWFKAWQFRHHEGLNGVSDELKQAPKLGH